MTKGDKISVNKTVTRNFGGNTKIIAESGQTGEYLAPFNGLEHYVMLGKQVLTLREGEFDVIPIPSMIYPPLEDMVVANVIGEFVDRSERGVYKYGTTLADNDRDDFLQHLKEELMDAVCYIQKLQYDEETLENRRKASSKENGANVSKPPSVH